MCKRQDCTNSCILGSNYCEECTDLYKEVHSVQRSLKERKLKEKTDMLESTTCSLPGCRNTKQTMQTMPPAIKNEYFCTFCKIKQETTYTAHKCQNCDSFISNYDDRTNKCEKYYAVKNRRQIVLYYCSRCK